MIKDAGNVLTTQLLNIPDTGLILFRIGAVNSAGETIRYQAGAWFMLNMPAPPAQTSGLSIP